MIRSSATLTALLVSENYLKFTAKKGSLFMSTRLFSDLNSSRRFAEISIAA